MPCKNRPAPAPPGFQNNPAARSAGASMHPGRHGSVGRSPPERQGTPPLPAPTQTHTPAHPDAFCLHWPAPPHPAKEGCAPGRRSAAADQTDPRTPPRSPPVLPAAGPSRPAAQQPGHLVQQLHDHVPLPGRLLRSVDALTDAQHLHLSGLLLRRPQLVQTEIYCPADLICVRAPHLLAQCLHRLYQQLTGSLGVLQLLLCLRGGLHRPKAPRIIAERAAPGCRPRRPGVGVVFQGTDLLL